MSDEAVGGTRSVDGADPEGDPAGNPVVVVAGGGFAVVFAGLAFGFDVPPTPLPIVSGVAIALAGARAYPTLRSWSAANETLSRRRILVQLLAYAGVFGLFAVVPQTVLYPFLWTLATVSGTAALVGAFRVLGGD
jgi:hypothetical protein